MSEENKKTLGILAEFANPGELLKAAEKVRDEGYRKFDVHSPFPIHGMDNAMGLRQSKLGFIVGAAGFLGCVGGMTLQWWVSAVEYPHVISGKPFFSFQAFVPVTFELTILFAAIAAVFGMFHLNRLPQLFHNVFYSEQFAKITDDGFMISIEADDPRFDEEKTKSFLSSIGGTSLELIEAK
ncbi:MAG: DUF3341 domain-containing protein [Calditrichaeota bacterium]|nr:MAG: DUF3341 domain-containing protein [Calditrichota bacterium]